MKHIPFSEANSSSASREIPHILWNAKVHWHIHKRLPPVPVVGQINPVHASPSHLFKVHFNIILPSGLPSGPFPSGLPTKTLHTPLLRYALPVSLHTFLFNVSSSPNIHLYLQSLLL